MSTNDPTSPSAFYSIGRRFSFTLIGVVSLILLIFAGLLLSASVSQMENELDARLSNTLKIAETSLVEPLWNFDYDTVQSFIDALFLDDSIVYLDIADGQKQIAQRMRAQYVDRDFAFFAESSRFVVTSSAVTREGQQIAQLRLAISKDGLHRELLFNIAVATALTLVIIASIALTSILISRRHISRPLQELQDSAQRIADGDLEADIRTRGNDEISHLAHSLSTMRDSIRRLFAELRQSHAQLEHYNRDLEQKVGARTAELAQAKDEAEQAKAEAEAASHAKSSFLANMSHELRTPLNAILGFAQLLSRSRELSTEQRENLQIIRRSGQHLLDLINDVLEISKIEAGRAERQEAGFDLHRLLGDLQALFDLRAQNQGLQFTCHLDSDLPRYVCGDEGKLRQILINLLGNAIKFTQEGRVTLEARWIHGELHCVVEDTGMGIAEEDMADLFNAFVQSNNRNQAHEGTGLGLAISQQFARLLGSKIEVQSRKGEGSRFTFKVAVEPVEEAAVAPIATPCKAARLQPGQPEYRLLIVDDQADNRRLLRQLLEEAGFVVREASDGLQGIEQCAQWHPHLVWMDMRMPLMDGYEATRRIKAANHQTVVVALTASAFEEERQRVMDAGCDDFVRKPFSEEDIFAALDRHLSIRLTCADDSASTEEPLPSIAAVLAQQPEAWRQQLHLASTIADDREVQHLLTQIENEHAALARELSEWVRDFRFDQIISQLEAIPAAES